MRALLLGLFCLLPLADAGARGFDLTVYNKGIAGQNSREGLARFQADVVDLHPDFVLIYFGLNDTLNEPKFLDLPSFSANLAKMVETAREAHIVPVLCTIHACDPTGGLKRNRPDLFGAEGPNGKIDRYNAAIRELASGKNVLLADFAGRTAALPPGSDWLGADGLHLSIEGYRLLAATFLDVLRANGLAAGQKIVCLGDSVTTGIRMAGAGRAEGNTYPGWLKRLAAEDTPAPASATAP